MPASNQAPTLQVHPLVDRAKGALTEGKCVIEVEASVDVLNATALDDLGSSFEVG